MGHRGRRALLALTTVTLLAAGCGSTSHRASTPPTTDTPGDEAICAKLATLYNGGFLDALGSPGTFASAARLLTMTASGAPPEVSAPLLDLAHAYTVIGQTITNDPGATAAVNAANASLFEDFAALQRFVDPHCPGLRAAASRRTVPPADQPVGASPSS